MLQKVNDPSGAKKAKAAAKAKKGRPPARGVFDIVHPQLASLKIGAGQCTKNGPLTGTGPGPRTYSIEFLERRRSVTPVAPVGPSADVADPYNADALSSQTVLPEQGVGTVYAPTQGPQPKPSTSGVTLQPVPVSQ